MDNECEAVIDALRTLGITGDSLFAGIREDLERGLVRDARARLDWVDVLVRIEGNARPVRVEAVVVRDCRTCLHKTAPGTCEPCFSCYSEDRPHWVPDAATHNAGVEPRRDSDVGSDLLDALDDFGKRGGRMVFWTCPNGCRDMVDWNHDGGKSVATCRKCGTSNSVICATQEGS